MSVRLPISIPQLLMVFVFWCPVLLPMWIYNTILSAELWFWFTILSGSFRLLFALLRFADGCLNIWKCNINQNLMRKKCAKCALEYWIERGGGARAYAADMQKYIDKCSLGLANKWQVKQETKQMENDKLNTGNTINLVEVKLKFAGSLKKYATHIAQSAILCCS